VSGPPADDNMEVHGATAAAPSSGAQHMEQRRTAGGRAERKRRERWSGDGSREVKKSVFASEPRRAEDKDSRGDARG
jgi:hypothetical protein